MVAYSHDLTRITPCTPIAGYGGARGVYIPRPLRACPLPRGNCTAGVSPARKAYGGAIYMPARRRRYGTQAGCRMRESGEGAACTVRPFTSPGPYLRACPLPRGNCTAGVSPARKAYGGAICMPARRRRYGAQAGCRMRESGEGAACTVRRFTSPGPYGPAPF